MSLLLDSHILLWYDQRDRRLSEGVILQLRDSTTQVFVSVVTIWELSIKRAIGRLPGSDSITQMALRNHFDLLPILPAHAEAITGFARHHKDPFDHLLLAQAMVEDLTLVTHDAVLARYGVPTLLV